MAKSSPTCDTQQAQEAGKRAEQGRYDSIAHPLDGRPDVVTRRVTSFWTGESKPKTAISHWQCELKRLFELAKVENGHAQRFRDTFATGLLLQGVSLGQVSILLAHASIRITERHYAP